MAWTSVSSNPWNAQWQRCLSSESNSNQALWLHPNVLDTGSSSLPHPHGTSPPAHHSLIPYSLETDPYVKIGNAFWCSCCIQGFWKQSACWWQVVCSSWPRCCQESSSWPEQKPSTLPIPFRSLNFQTLDLWWADVLRTVKDASFQLYPRSILEKHRTSPKHPWPERWWTAWLSRAWCAAVWRVSGLCPPEGCWWHPLLCKACPPAQAIPSSCNAEQRPYDPTCTESMSTWWARSVILAKSSPSFGQHKYTTCVDHNEFSPAHTSPLYTSPLV